MEFLRFFVVSGAGLLLDLAVAWGVATGLAAPLWLAALRSVPWRALSDTERAQLLADIDKGPSRASVMRARLWALWRFARVEAAREGVAPVARRTVRFIWRRVRRR